MKFQLFVFKRSKLEIIGLILIATFLLLNSTPGETFWGKKIKELSHEDLGEIARELLLYGDPDFPRYNDIFYRNYRDPKELLNALNTEIEINQEMMEIIDIDERKIGGLTYGVYILNAINEKNLVEIGSKFAFKPDKATGQFFQKLADNLAYWKPQVAKIILEQILKGVFVASGSPGFSIGVSTLGLATNLTLIGIGINKLNDLLYERGFWHYFQSRKLGHDHNTAWEVAKITGAGAITNKNEKQTEEYFKSLWDTYGKNISDDGLKEDFKANQRKKLKTLLLYALGAEAHPVIGSPLKITPPPYQEGDQIKAEFTITNEGKRPIFLKTVTVGGRYGNKQEVIDFTKRHNIKLDIDESYEYHGTLTLAKAGNYHFFCAYQTSDGKWNPSVDLGPRLTDKDRIEDIVVKVREEVERIAKQKESKQLQTRSELARIGDFSIGLADIKREENTTTLHFAITKVSDIDSGHQSLQVTLIDDHGNEYSGNLGINLQGASDGVLNALPKGFTYVDMVSISMPKIAPIETIKLGDIKEIAFKKVKFDKPQLMKNFGHLAITKEQSVAVGKWLSFTMAQILPAPGHWELPITIESKEYSPLPIGVRVATQHDDGTISWSRDESVTVLALSKTSVKVALPIPSWVKGGPPQPKVLLNVYSDRSPDKGKTILKMFPMTPGDLPPLVGQGPKEIEDVFLQAYKRNGGQKIMGNPICLPHWLAGVGKPKDENDVFLQEFPSVSDSGKSTIIWDKQGSATKAYVLHEPIWGRYFSSGGPYYTSKAQNVSIGPPTSDRIVVKRNDSYLRTQGSYNTFKGGAIASQRGEAFFVLGKIYAKWKKKGCGAGPLGFPVEEEQPSATSGAQGFNTTGLIQNFEDGRIYYHMAGKLATKVLEIHGDIYTRYLQMGRETSWLGFPVREEYRSIGKKRFGQVEFEGGYIGSKNGQKWEALPYETGKIAFVSNRDGNQEIYVMDTSGANLVNLTNNPANDRDPAWSPDGSKIAFVSHREPRGIYLMDADGSNQKFLAPGWAPAWFPEGSKIAFTSTIKFEKHLIGGITMKKSRARIFVMHPDGSNRTELTFDAAKLDIDSEDHGFPAVSPDGHQIAFQIYRYDHNPVIAIMNLKETNVASIYKLYKDLWRRSHYHSRYPSWSPDGKKLTAARYVGRGIPSDIYIIDPHAVSLEKLGVSGRATSWSLDGRRIVFSNGKDIYIIHSDGSMGRRVTKGEGDNWDPSWSAPRSKTIVKVEGEAEINLSYTVDQFIADPATGTLSLPVIRSEQYRFYFPWIASHIDTAWSVILPITFEVTDSDDTPISGAQIFMGQQKLGLTDNSGKFTYKYVVRVPKRENKVIELPFSAKKNGVSTSINIPFTWSVLETTSIHIASKEDYEKYIKVLYQYEFFQSKLPLPKQLIFLTPFLPLLKIAYDLKKGPQIGDRIDILLIEHRILGKNPVVWAYYEQMGSQSDMYPPHFATGWIISPKDKQRVLDTYFLIKKA